MPMLNGKEGGDQVTVSSMRAKERGNNIYFPISWEIFWIINIMKYYIIVYHYDYHAYILYIHIYMNNVYSIYWLFTSAVKNRIPTINFSIYIFVHYFL